MKVTEQILCIAMNAHRQWLNNNCSKKERLAGIDSFGAWRAAFEAVFSLGEGGAEPTLIEFVKNHPARNNKMLVVSEMELISEYLEKYMKEKD